MHKSVSAQLARVKRLIKSRVKFGYNDHLLTRWPSCPAPSRTSFYTTASDLTAQNGFCWHHLMANKMNTALTERQRFKVPFKRIILK